MSLIPPHSTVSSWRARSVMSSFLNLQYLLLGCNTWLGKCLQESMTQISYLIIILFIRPNYWLLPTLTDCGISATADSTNRMGGSEDDGKLEVLKCPWQTTASLQWKIQTFPANTALQGGHLRLHVCVSSAMWVKTDHMTSEPHFLKKSSNKDMFLLIRERETDR